MTSMTQLQANCGQAELHVLRYALVATGDHWLAANCDVHRDMLTLPLLDLARPHAPDSAIFPDLRDQSFVPLNEQERCFLGDLLGIPSGEPVTAGDLLAATEPVGTLRVAA